jgi:hypothetical protein
MQSKDGGHVALHVWERRNTQISYIQSLQGDLKAPCFIRLRCELVLFMVCAIYGLFVRTKIQLFGSWKLSKNRDTGTCSIFFDKVSITELGAKERKDAIEQNNLSVFT